MLSSFVKNSAIYYLSNLLTKGISFFLLPFYTSVFTQADYGVLEMVSIVSTLVIVIFTFQINEGVGRYYNELTTKASVRLYTSSVALFALVSFGIFFCLSAIFISPIAEFISLPKPAALIATAAISLNGLFYLLQNQLTWKIKPTEQMICGLAYNLVTIGLTILFILYYKNGVEGVFMAQILGALAGIVLGVYFNRDDLRLRLSDKVIRKLLKFSLPLIPNALAIYVFMYMDRIFIQKMLGNDELGIYGFSFKIASILMIAHFGMSTALSPLIYKHYKEAETPQKITTIFRVFTLVSMTTMLALTVFSTELVTLLAGRPGYEEAALYIPLLLFSIYVGSLTQFFPGLIIAKNTRLISLISISMGVLNFIANYFLIDAFGIIGACIATAVASFINYFLYRHFSNKTYKVPIKNLLFFTGVVVYGLFSTAVLYFDFSWVQKIVVFIPGVIIMVLIFMRRSDLFYLKKLIRSRIQADITP